MKSMYQEFQNKKKMKSFLVSSNIIIIITPNASFLTLYNNHAIRLIILNSQGQQNQKPNEEKSHRILSNETVEAITEI